MEIYKRINDHKMMNNDDLVNIINDRLKKLNLYYKDNNVIFKNDKDLYFKYASLNNEIYISNDYKRLTLKPILESAIGVKKKDKNSYFNDFFNLELLISPYHEVRHYEQYNKIIEGLTDYNTLIYKSLSYMIDNRKFYEYNHPRFLSEHDAELNAMMLILYNIENGNINVCKKSLCFFNTNIAYFLLRSRGFIIEDQKLKKKSIFKSPLHMLYFCNRSLYLKRLIDKKEYESVISCIINLRNKNKTEYDRIISGDSLSDETINELFLIEKGIIKTENIFKYFENKQLDKNNNHYVKKLILSKE